ncbi:hypothetical protein ACX8XP_05435 [Calditrichota bacterium LG25]
MRKILYWDVCCMVILGLILFMSSNAAYGQEKSLNNDRHFWWGNVGMGSGWVAGGLGSNDGGLTFGVNFSGQSKNNILSVRYVIVQEFQLLWPDLPEENVWDVGLLYGKSAKASYGLASIAAGIGVVGGVRRGDKIGSSGGFFEETYYEKLTFLTVGVPIETQLFWTPFSFVGIGIYGFANLNMEKSYWGGLFSIQFGKLR